MRSHTCLVLALALAACSDTELPEPDAANVVDTATIGALAGTPVTVPSGFSVVSGAPVRTDNSNLFDFAYDYDPVTDRHFFLPLQVLGLGTSGVNPGLQRRDESFDAITEARSNGYVDDDTVFVQPDERYMLRSRVTCSSLGGVPIYGKMEVLSVDVAQRLITFRYLVNVNCGYRQLTPGLPEE